MTRVTQKSGHDCVLACVAMALNQTWEECWTQEDLDAVIASNGTHANTELEKKGLARNVDFVTAYTNSMDGDTVCRLLWGRPAILSVPSLNVEGGSHAVYYDGRELHDPNPEHKERYRFLSSCRPTCVTMLAVDLIARLNIKNIPQEAAQ